MKKCCNSLSKFTGEAASKLRCNYKCERYIYVTTSYGELEADTYYLCKDGVLTKLSSCNATITTNLFPSDYTGWGVSCNGSTNGTINLVVSGGTPPYTYLWNDGATTEDRSGLGAGIYSVVVSDSGGCTGTGEVEITQPNELIITIDSIVPESGPGFEDGAIYITVTGGTPTYIYTWTGSYPGQDLLNHPAGLYTVQVLDQNGCTATLIDIEIPADY